MENNLITTSNGLTLPIFIKNSIDEWVEHRIKPGHFTIAVLENNLMETINRADDESMIHLRDIVRYLINNCPTECWGNSEIVNNWSIKFIRRKMEFKNIKQLTSISSNGFCIEWTYLEKWIREHNKDRGLEFEPDFQRGHVWDNENRRKYVEYVLKGGSSGRNIYFNCTGWISGEDAVIQIVDGLQRLTAVRMFINNEIKIFDHYYREYNGRPKVEFIFYVNNLQTRKEVLQWYIDLNDGGIVHTKEELQKVRKLLEQS